jgi:CheY-like chemotaxis protein
MEPAQVCASRLKAIAVKAVPDNIRYGGDHDKRTGAVVVEAASADKAIAILESRLDITVVFTDIQMPGSMDCS